MFAAATRCGFESRLRATLTPETMTKPKSVFAVLLADKRTGDMLHSMKLFVDYEQAREHALALRKKHEGDMHAVVLQETDIIYPE